MKDSIMKQITYVIGLAALVSLIMDLLLEKQISVSFILFCLVALYVIKE